MDPNTDTLTLIKTCFGGRDALIERAFRQSESFRSLCEDYHECAAALDRWKHRDAPNASLRRQEYAELLVELDREIQRWLEALESGAAPQGEPGCPGSGAEDER